MNLRKTAYLILVLAGLLTCSSCSNKSAYSSKTGWKYNEAENGGFFVQNKYQEQVTGPGLVFIEGGTFTMGQVTDNVMGELDNAARRVSISSFYMDETEVANVDYLEYLYWLSRIYGKDYPEIVRKALPDTLVWRAKLGYNEPMVTNYLRHPSYRNYPVVGVSWVQAKDYCLWRSDRVNEQILVEYGILNHDPAQNSRDHFTTATYLANQYIGNVNKNLKDNNPNGTGERGVRWEDGILLPNYRLPTEAEWEYAAYGLVGNSYANNIAEKRIYPWNKNIIRTDSKEYYGSLMANFRPNSGDYMGVAGALNDGSMFPAEVGSYWPNDYGLYNMAGNVAEWVFDVYRPSSFYDVADMNPVRGNIFTQPVRDADGNLVEKDEYGNLTYEKVSIEDNKTRRNYRQADNINYLDGDALSQIDENSWHNDMENDNLVSENMYQYGNRSLISDETRVYKGGSWLDPAYYLSPSARRFLHQNEATNYIGFRCVMDRTGQQVTFNY
jgi:formylglycine-generating enzyme